MTESAYLLVGEEFLVDEALAKIRAEAQTDPLSEVSFDAGAPAHEILAALETPSLLGGRRLVVVEGAQELDAEQSRGLERYLSSPSPDSVLVLAANGRTKLLDAVKKAGAVVALEPPRGRALAGWVRHRAAARRLSLDDGASWALVNAAGTDLRDLDSSLDQLVAAVGEGARATAADVRRHFPRVAEQRVYAFTNAVSERKLDEAMSSLRQLFVQGEHPLMVLQSLANQLRRMLIARRSAEEGPGALAESLGLARWQAERLHRQIRAYREEELVAGIQALADCDLEIKGGDLPPEAALEGAVVAVIGVREVSSK